MSSLYFIPFIQHTLYTAISFSYIPSTSHKFIPQKLYLSSEMCLYFFFFRIDLLYKFYLHLVMAEFIVRRPNCIFKMSVCVILSIFFIFLFFFS